MGGWVGEGLASGVFHFFIVPRPMADDDNLPIPTIVVNQPYPLELTAPVERFTVTGHPSHHCLTWAPPQITFRAPGVYTLRGVLRGGPLYRKLVHVVSDAASLPASIS